MRNFWIEKSYYSNRNDRVSGDRALGKAIWSPREGKNGRNYYANMKLVKNGDIILHLVDNKLIIGQSVVKSKNIKKVNGLENVPEPWSKKIKCYLWELESFQRYPNPIIVDDFLKNPLNSYLLDLIDQVSEVFYDKRKYFRQGAYLTPARRELFTFLNIIHKTHFDSNMPYYNDAEFYDVSTNDQLTSLIEKDLNKIKIRNKAFGSKGVSKVERHNKIVSNLKNQFKRMGFDYYSELISMGQGDIDLLVCHEKTMIVFDIKTGKDSYIREKWTDFNGKLAKHYHFLINNYENRIKADFKLRKDYEDWTNFIDIHGIPDKIIHVYVVGDMKLASVSKMKKEFIQDGRLETGSTKVSSESANYQITKKDILHHTEFERYFKSDYPKKLSKLEFLARFNIDPEKENYMEIPAIKVQNINKHYDMFLFTCSAKALINFASVSRRQPGSESDNHSAYQRLLDTSRLSNIASFIDTGGYFANNIIIKLNDKNYDFTSLQKEIDISVNKNDKSLKSRIEKSTSSNSEFGILSIKESYQSAWIIDGQHRLLSYLKSTKSDIVDSINVAALVGLTEEQEINFFVHINDNASPVPKNLIWDINGEIAPETIEGIISNIGKKIDKTSILDSNKNELNLFKDKLGIPRRRKRAKFSFGGFCRTFFDDNSFKNYESDIKPKKIQRWDANQNKFEDITNPFFARGVNFDKIVDTTSKAYLSFSIELNKHLDKKYIELLYNKDGIISVLLRIAQHYFNFHKKNTLKENDNFFQIFASIIMNYTEEEFSNLIKQSTSDQGKAVVETGFLLDIIDKYDEKFYLRKPSKLVLDVKKIVESQYDESLSSFVYRYMRKKYNINIILKLPAYKNKINKMRAEGKSSGRCVIDEHLYRMTNMTEIKDNVIYNNNAIFKNDDDESFSLNLWEEDFSKIFKYRDDGLGYRDRQKLSESLKDLQKYKDHTVSHGDKDLYKPLVRKEIEATYKRLRALLDRELDMLN
jgi:DGQHR domain-containing protein